MSYNAGCMASTVGPSLDHFRAAGTVQVQRERTKFAMVDAVMRRRTEAVENLLRKDPIGPSCVQGAYPEMNNNYCCCCCYYYYYYYYYYCCCCCCCYYTRLLRLLCLLTVLLLVLLILHLLCFLLLSGNWVPTNAMDNMFVF